jgi:YfiH family protein
METMALRQASLLKDQKTFDHGFFGMPEPFDPQADREAGFQKQLDLIACEMDVVRSKMVAVDQIHSAKVRVVGSPWQSTQPEADAMVCDRTGITLVLKTADCAPVLLCDPQAGVIAAAHAGWRGALAGILQQTVMNMGFLGAKPERIIAAIGPCISAHSYEVGNEFVEKFLGRSIENAQFFTQEEGKKPHFGLAGFCAHQLNQVGIFGCEVVNTDTFDEKNQFFSYRRACKGGESGYGRNISVIHLS